MQVLVETQSLFIQVVIEHSRSSGTLCQLLRRHHSLSNLLGMFGLQSLIRVWVAAVQDLPKSYDVGNRTKSYDAGTRSNRTSTHSLQLLVVRVSGHKILLEQALVLAHCERRLVHVSLYHLI